MLVEFLLVDEDELVSEEIEGFNPPRINDTIMHNNAEYVVTKRFNYYNSKYIVHKTRLELKRSDSGVQGAQAALN